MIRPASFTIAASCALASLAGWAAQTWAQSEIDRLETSVSQRSSMLATERGLIAERERIEREYALSRSLSAGNARGELIEALRRMKGITIKRLDLENEGKRVTIELSGHYGDLISAAVGLPARIAGLTIERLALSAGGDADPVARLEGNFT